MNPPEISPQDQMMQFITAKWISQPIKVAAQLGIADLLADGPMNVEDLAEKTGTHAPTLYRLLRALAGRGIFEEQEGEVFGLTPMAQCLQTGAMRGLALTFLSDWHEKAWASLAHSVKTGGPAFDHAFGQPAFEWLEEHPDESALFNQFQSEKTARFIPAVVGAYDFSGIKKLADIGGGTGALVLEILKANPDLKGCVAELPQVARQAGGPSRPADWPIAARRLHATFYKQRPRVLTRSSCATSFTTGKTGPAPRFWPIAARHCPLAASFFWWSISCRKAAGSRWPSFWTWKCWSWAAARNALKRSTASFWTRLALSWPG
jgi:hypothetical protein